MTPRTASPVRESRTGPGLPARPRPRAARRLTPLLLILALGAGSCARSGAGGFKPPPTPVEVSRVEAHPLRDDFHALGTIEADENVEVVSEIDAVVRQLPFREGQPVSHGELLAQLDDREIRAQVQRAEALRAQEAAHYDRARTLFGQNMVSAQELEDAHAALHVAEANLAVAQAQLDKTRITSPLDGVVGRRRVSPGAFLRTGDRITEVARVTPVKVVFSAPERYASKLRAGVTVSLTTPAWPGVTFHGRLRVVDPLLDPQTRTIQAEAVIPNRDRRLRPGMSADLAVALSVKPNALMVPDEAIFAQGDQVFVYRVKSDSTVTRTAIQLGLRDSSRAEVLKGLEAGDLVVRAGHQKLYEGARVMPTSSGGPAGPGDGTSARGAGTAGGS